MTNLYKKNTRYSQYSGDGQQVIHMYSERSTNGSIAGGIEMFECTGMLIQRRMTTNGKASAHSELYAHSIMLAAC